MDARHHCFYDFLRVRGTVELTGEASSGLAGFSVIGMGALRCVVAGAWADRLGREPATIWAMAVGGTCPLVVGWLVAAPVRCSALVIEVAPPHAVGTALTLQTSLGFLLTAGSIAIAVEVASRFGWGPAFSMLAVGPALGIGAMRRLKNVRFAVISDG